MRILWLHFLYHVRRQTYVANFPGQFSVVHTLVSYRKEEN